MVRQALPALAIALGSGLLATCSPLDLVEPDPRAPGASAQIFVTEGTGVDIDVKVDLWAGVDASGRSNNVVENHVLVNGTVIDPAEHKLPDIYSYLATITTPSGTAPAWLDVRLPRVEGFPGDQVQGSLPVLRRSGPMNLSRAEQPDRLTLAFAWDGLPMPTLWALELKASCTGSPTAVVFRGAGNPPSPFVLPWDILATVLPQQFEACLSIRAQHRFQDGQYTATLSFGSWTSWSIDTQ